MPKNKYLFYACYKNGHNGGMYYDGKCSAQEAKDDLMRLINAYLTNDVVFLGIIKCNDGKPLEHITPLQSSF